MWTKGHVAVILQSGGCQWQVQTFALRWLRSNNTSLAGVQKQISFHYLKEVCSSVEGRLLIHFMLSVATPLSHWRLIVEDFSFETPQATLQVGAGFWLQGLRELDIIWTVNLRLPLDGVLNSLRSEVVNNWIKAAVGHCDAEGYWVDGSDHRLHKTTF